VLDHEVVSVVIPGASSPAQARENAAAAALRPLSRDLHERLATFYAESVADFVRGPS
jgi:aryl-alcohol dehydrogenase-like predicted oxidoreductase